MKNLNVSKMFVSFAMIFVLSASVFAMQPEEQPGCGEDFACPNQGQLKSKEARDKEMKAKMEKMDKELKLTAEQKAKMDELRKTDKEKRVALIKQLIEKKQAINDELLKADYDKTVITDLTNDIRFISADIAQLQIDGKIQIRNILTYEQFQKIEKHRTEMKKERNEKMKKLKDKTDKK